MFKGERGEGLFCGGGKATYLEEEAERDAGGEGVVVDHGAEEGGTAGLGEVGAEAAVKGPRERCGGR